MNIFEERDELLTIEVSKEEENSGSVKEEDESESAKESETHSSGETRTAKNTNVDMGGINIHINGMTVREEADIDKIAEELVRRIKRTSLLMPNI